MLNVTPHCVEKTFIIHSEAAVEELRESYLNADVKMLAWQTTFARAAYFLPVAQEADVYLFI